MASSPQHPPKVQKTTLTFKTDIRKSQLDAVPCGVLHASRSSPNGREEHSFAWIVNYQTVDAALAHLERYGFTRDQVQFIPFSSKANWVTKYPHAFPYVDCDNGGNVSGFPHWSPQAQSVLDIPPEVVLAASQPHTIAAMNASAVARGGGGDGWLAATPKSKKKGKGNANRLANTLLNNNERQQLHNEIYKYISWLTNQVVDLETSESGRRSVKKAKLKVAGLRGLLVKMEATFNIHEDVANTYNVVKGVITPDKMNPALIDDVSGPVPVTPLLEENLTNEMSNLAAVEEEAQKKAKALRGESPKKKAHWEPLDFDSMFEKLLLYKAEHGHPNVPVKYQRDLQLGSWVSGLRMKKKAYDKDGDPLMEEEIWPTTDNDEEANTPAKASLKYLNRERIDALDSIGFTWVMAKPKSKPKSWDERLVELQQWHEDHGTFKVPRQESLGEWLHNQRTLYGKRDTKFMTKKAPRLEGIGYTFNVRENTSVSWDDRFQQLCEHHRQKGTFDVQCPVSEEDDTRGDSGNSPETQEKYKFYKWVSRLHNEYRAYEKGTSSKLNDERVEKLRGINFQFKGPKSRGRPSSSNLSHVPKLSWEKRMQQLKSFKADTGHLNIDHNYKHCSNLGGWAADISSLYKNWKAGSQLLSEDMTDKLYQLIELGFEFNVLPYYENNRSWDDNYEILLKFKELNNGSARVPLKYKADLRLGKWVQNQRQQYKLLQDGKTSKLSEERIEKLEIAGFEWEGRGGAVKDEDEEEADV